MNFVDKNFPTVAEINLFVREYVEKSCNGVFPEDEWVSIGDSWDINLWIAEVKEGVTMCVTMYPVVNNVILSSSGIRIY